MNKRQELVNASIDNALAVLRNSWFDKPRLAVLREELEDVESVIRRLKIEQNTEGHRRLGDLKGGAAKLRGNLRRLHLRPISREGKRRLKGYPGIDEDLRLPRKQESDAALLKAAKRILDSAARHKSVYLEAKFAADFIERAERAVAALIAREGVATGLEFEAASLATAALKPALKHAREIIHSVDAIIESEMADDPKAIKLWRKHKRIPKSLGGRPRKPRE